MQGAPFVFGKTAEGENFTNRKDECARLKQNFFSLTNTTIVSPRRWGKSSLVKAVAKECMAKDKKLKVCIIDLFSVRSEGEFYAHFASSIIRATSSKWEERLGVAKEFLSHLRPQIVFSPNHQEEISFDIEWEKAAQDPDKILELPEKIAHSKGLRLVVCIDEFQNVGEFKESLAFQKNFARIGKMKAASLQST